MIQSLHNNPLHNTSELAAFPCLCDDDYEGYHCEFKAGTVPECLLNCQNGGDCVVGIISPSEGQHMNHKWSLQETEDHMRCVCPPGFGGAFCESPAEECGDSICLHGGTCVTTTQVLQDGVVHTQSHCDCTDAGDIEGNLYAGQYCEHQATAMCSETDWNLFCTQGGQCKINPIEGCSCPSGTAGYKCEFILDNMYNDGTTTQDSDVGFDGDVDFEDSQDEDDDDNDNDDDSQSTRCGDGYCQNGAACVIEEVINGSGVEDIKSFCDCSEAAVNNGAYFAGDYCQYKSTSICGGQDNFCVHGGDCRTDGGCDCPIGWAGNHCETSWVDDNVPVDIQPGQGGEMCGEHVCYNGGACAETEMIGPDGSLTITLHCDCASAYDDQYSYAGLNCEFPSTSLCTQPVPGEDLADVLYCVNHGTCMVNPRLGCDCPPGFYGFACEYENQNHDSDGDGVPDMEDQNNFSDDDWEICGDDGLVCHNGGRCETTVVQNSQTGDTETTHTCDCRTAYVGDTPFSGVACEYPATELCAPPDDGEPPTLGQFCTNHGTCRLDTSRGSCDCPDGFTGSSCQFKASYNDIVDAEDGDLPIDHEDCGDDLACLNGGTCVTTILAGGQGNNMEIKHCDCALAMDETEIFAGKSCEFKATSLCASPVDGSVGNIHFCVNGGECPDGNNPMMPCQCDIAWEGFHCEYAVAADDLPPQFHDNIDGDDNDGCGLQCVNGGYCAEGAKDLGSLHDTISDVYHLNQTFDNEHFAHCVCPEGFVGLTCQHKIEVCGNEEHVCLHGSTCVEHENGQHSCDCSDADEIVGKNEKPLFAGDSCQYTGTDICTIGEGYPGEPLYFCVNGGSCNAQVTSDQPDPGCQCPDDYVGPHCETLTRVSSERSSSSGNAAKIAGAIMAVFAIAVVAITVAVRMTRYKSAAAVEEPSSSSGTGTPFPRRRRRKAGYGGSNMAPGRTTSRASSPIVSSSDPMASGFALPPDDEPEGEDAIDGILKEPINGEPDFVDVVGPQQEADFV
ncbi:MAG: hypothetical protein SGILL_003424 [Bacillariaceae sp.]